MTAYVNAIGIFGSLLTTIGFIQSNIPANADPQGATVAIKGKTSIIQTAYSIFDPVGPVTDIFVAGLPPLDKEGDSLVSLHTRTYI